MARQRHLRNAPITEALIDLQLRPHEGLTFEELEKTISAAKEIGYYVKSPIAEGMFGVKIPLDFAQRAQLEGQAARVGLRLHSHDEKYVAQYRLSGFTLSRLRPYEQWENLLNEARRLWDIYVERLSPVGVTRVATRYINSLQLPLRLGESFQKYMLKFVDVPAEVPQAVESFLERFQLVDLDTNARVILTLAPDKVTVPERVPVILDIDAFMLAKFELESPAIWTTLENLRALKNRCFFGTITEAAAELYE